MEELTDNYHRAVEGFQKFSGNDMAFSTSGALFSQGEENLIAFLGIFLPPEEATRVISTAFGGDRVISLVGRGNFERFHENIANTSENISFFDRGLFKFLDTCKMNPMFLANSSKMSEAMNGAYPEAFAYLNDIVEGICQGDLNGIKDSSRFMGMVNTYGGGNAEIVPNVALCADDVVPHLYPLLFAAQIPDNHPVFSARQSIANSAIDAMMNSRMQRVTTSPLTKHMSFLYTSLSMHREAMSETFPSSVIENLTEKSSQLYLSGKNVFPLVTRLISIVPTHNNGRDMSIHFNALTSGMVIDAFNDSRNIKPVTKMDSVNVDFSKMTAVGRASAASESSDMQVDSSRESDASSSSTASKASTVRPDDSCVGRYFANVMELKEYEGWTPEKCTVFYILASASPNSGQFLKEFGVDDKTIKRSVEYFKTHADSAFSNQDEFRMLSNTVKILCAKNSAAIQTVDPINSEIFNKANVLLSSVFKVPCVNDTVQLFLRFVAAVHPNTHEVLPTLLTPYEFNSLNLTGINTKMFKNKLGNAVRAQDPLTAIDSHSVLSTKRMFLKMFLKK